MIDGLHEPWIDALGWSLIHSLWQGGLLAILLAVGLASIPHSAARLRYGLCLGALVLWFVTWLATWLVTLSILSSQPSTMLQTPAIEAIHHIPGPASWKAWLDEHMLAAVATWAFGVGLLSIRSIGGIHLARRLTTKFASPAPHFLQRQFDRMCQPILSRCVPVLMSARAITPMVVGHLKPVLLLPVGIMTTLTPAQLEAVLAHELGHLIRRDYLVNLIHTALETLFFFHPAMWWISARAREEREHCCDDYVRAIANGPLNLAKAILHLQEVHMNPSRFAMAAVGSQNTMHRIRRLLEPPSPRSPIIATISLIAGLLLFSLACTAAMRPVAPIQNEGKGSGEIVIRSHDQNLKIRTKNGQIVAATRNGEAVPEDEYPQLEEMIQQHEAELRIKSEELARQAQRLKQEQLELQRANEEMKRSLETLVQEEKKRTQHVKGQLGAKRQQLSEEVAALKRAMQAEQAKVEASMAEHRHQLERERAKYAEEMEQAMQAKEREAEALVRRREAERQALERQLVQGEMEQVKREIAFREQELAKKEAELEARAAELAERERRLRQRESELE